MIDSNDIIQFLYNPLAYEQKLVSAINEKGEQIPLSASSELHSGNITVKVEGMERFSATIYNKCEFYKLKHDHGGPVTCHLFLAAKNSPSFGMHTDPDDVIIYCVEGTKTLTVGGDYIVLNQGDEVYIPANVPHIAHNEYPAMTLSFGLEKYLIDKAKNYELDHISKDNGNL